MKGKQLRKAVLLGMAMSMAVWTTGMAADHSQITDTETITDSNITVANNDNDQGAIDIRDGKNVNVSLTTAEGEGENHDIQINSEGYGILTRDNSTGTITLDSLGNNSINFKDGSGISADSGVAIKLEADGDNTIMYTGDGDHDGINAGANNKGNITLLGTKNEIRVLGNESDGIYTGVGSISDEIMIATDGDNTITAGNNGIDHRGSGDVILTAENGGNIIHAGEGQAEGDLEGDGIRVEGNGDVFLDAKYNKITGHDEGIYTDVANSQINITSTSIDENGIGNYIEGADNGIQIIGRKKIGDGLCGPICYWPEYGSD